MPPKKQVQSPIKTRARARSIDTLEQVKEEDQGPGDFRDTMLNFQPAIPRSETAITIQFRCTVKIIRGDTIVIRLPGFKGQAGVFTLESRPHPEGKAFHDYFHAYWAGENAPKGGPPSNTITLQCRKPVDPNSLVIFGVPESFHIVLPDKLAQNSPKLKIEGVIKHCTGGKIPKAAVMACNEVKKKPIDDDIAELDNMLKELQAKIGMDEEDLRQVTDVTVQEADNIWESARDFSRLRIGLAFRAEGSIFTTFDEWAPLAGSLIENYKAASKRRIPFALHKEIAANLGVKPSLIIVLEEAIHAQQGCFYPDLSRAAILVLRLYTMESHDVARVLGLVKGLCIYREVNSALRNIDADGLKKWTFFIATLMSCANKLTHVSTEVIPHLFRGVKDLPSEAIAHLQQLKKDDWYLFPTFTSWVTEGKYTDDNFISPDNAVLFEVRAAVEACELGDVSQYPEDTEWMLPMFSSFAVSAVEVLPEKNNLTRVELRMRGSIGGVLRDENFPEDLRSLSSAVIRKIKTDCGLLGDKTALVARIISASMKLQQAKSLHPNHLTHVPYLDKYGDVKRQSEARNNIFQLDEVKWQSCTQEATVEPGGIIRAAQFDMIPKKTAVIIEQYFLKMTRAQKQFTAPDGMTMDFGEWSADFGKGPKKIRRMVGKHVSHPYSAM